MIVASTGRTLLTACFFCGTTILHRESETTVKRFWHPERHDAPCGLPCLNGGVPRVAYRMHHVHGYSTPARCDRCGVLDVHSPDDGGDEE